MQNENLDFSPENEDDYETTDILTLTDENGDDFQFEVIDSVEHNGLEYVAVVEVFDEDKAQNEEPVLIIFRVGEPDEEGFDTYDIVDDDEEYFEIAGVFEKRLSEIYNIEE